jgi:formimidoylglutamate deiminase
MAESSLHCARLLAPEGWRRDVVLWIDEDGMIFDMETGKAGEADQSLPGHVLPGMANLHSHAFQRLMAGLGGACAEGEDSFWTWREVMYRLAGELSPLQVEAAAAMLQAEMLESGYTACGEFHYLHHGPDGREYPKLAEMSCRLLEASRTSGIALTLLPVLYCRSGFGASGVLSQQARFYNSPERFIDLFEACRELLANEQLHRLGVAPHSLRAVSPDQLEQVLEAVSAAAVSVHIHVAEQPEEVADCIEHLGRRPLQWLLDHREVDDRWCLVHATHLEHDELEKAAASGAVAGLCPSTEADLGDGFFQAEAWIDAGGKFGIGSDSNLRVCVAEELRLLENESRLLTGRRNVLSRGRLGPGRFLFEQALAGGARALGQPLGKIAPGCRADLVELDENHLLLSAREEDDVLDTWLFAGDRTMIRTVCVGGQAVVVNGRHRARPQLENDFRAVMEALAG